LAAVTPILLEAHVFSKSYFDPNNLLVADSGSQIIGAAICGFGPDRSGDQLDPRCGILSGILFGDSSTNEFWRSLVSAAIDRLRSQGASLIHFGSRFPDSPYLAGIQGGTFVPGVLRQDAYLASWLETTGFQTRESIDVFKIDVRSFRPPVDRRAILAKRNYEVHMSVDPPPTTWWQHIQYSFRHQYEYRIFDRRSRHVSGHVTFCNSRANEAGWDTRFFGISRIEVSAELQRSGLAQAMLFEAIKDLERKGVEELEAQVPRSNIPCQALLQKIGFRPWYTALQMHL
jgi:GNAT superfamily N-acetyltransferase